MTDPSLEPALEQLAVAAQNDDRVSFQRLVERTQSKAFSLAFRLLADEDDARDVTQESFIRLWKNLCRYDASQRFESWFYRMVTNIAVDHLRARKRWWKLFQRKQELMADIPDPTDAVRERSNAEVAAIIRGLTNELPLKQRTVLILRDFQDLNTEDVAQVLGMSMESVKTNLYYARTRIRELLKNRYGISRENL